MAVFKPENVEDFYEIGEVLGRYEHDMTDTSSAVIIKIIIKTSS